MKLLQKILVGLAYDQDGTPTEGSRVAARQALWLAERTGAKVEFIHSTYRDNEDLAPPLSEPGAAARRHVDQLLEEPGQRAIISGLTVVEERPWIAMIQRALSGDVDLVVVAKRNQTRRDDRRLGSVSIKLVRKCPTPVWVVKPEHPPRHQCVLAATDLSAVGDLATEYGAFIAQAEESKLCVVHAWSVPMEVQLGAARAGANEAASQRKQITAAALAHIRALPTFAELGDAGEVFLACDSPSNAILNLAEQEKPDLAVIGTVSRGGLAGLVVGNTAEKLLHRLDCSLLTVKPADFVCPIPPADSATPVNPGQ